ncbi:MAG: hypothetical protein D6692_13490 [Planctomycetota bacterium]|nr:MAG: hypothetical protein D6692_13490 [Planctomycetota bacterium]
MWPVSAIVQACCDAVRSLDEALRDEQAVHGVDAAEEVRLHPVLAGGLLEAGFGVVREAVYPGEHAAGVRRSKRARCDLVLLPEPGLTLEDPATEQAALNRAEGTLFAELADTIAEPVGRVAASDAYWLEIKSVAQHAFVDGVPVSNRAYESQMVRGLMGDAVKLAADASIWSAGAMLILFAGSEDIANHDLHAVAHRLLDEGVPVGTPEIGGVPIEDRVGNAWCGIGLFPIRVSG